MTCWIYVAEEAPEKNKRWPCGSVAAYSEVSQEIRKKIKQAKKTGSVYQRIYRLAVLLYVCAAKPNTSPIQLICLTNERT